MQPLLVEIVSDVVCPWCFVGKRHLDSVLAMLRDDIPGLAVTVCWQPFFLNPGTPPAGEPYRPFLERKFGGAAAVEALWQRVRQAGRAAGIEFAFEKITVRANTLQAHRLLHWAQQQAAGSSRVDALVEGLFAAHFLHGEHVGDAAVLQRLAAEAGFPAQAVAGYLAGDADTELVRAQERRWREAGVASAPTFVFDGRSAFAGAASPEILASAIRTHLRDAAAA